MWIDASFISEDNFSYHKIEASKTVTIPENQTMCVPLSIDVEGTLEIDGRAFLFDEITESEFSYRKIKEGKSVTIPHCQEMSVSHFIDIEGSLEILGSLNIYNDETAPEQIPFPTLPDDNFSHYFIPAAITKTIPLNQEMLLSRSLEIEGTLDVEGRVNFTDPDPDPIVYPDNFSFRDVILGSTILIPEQQLMLLSDFLDVEGTLNIEGSLEIIEPRQGYPENFSYYKITPDIRVIIPENQQMTVVDGLDVEGILVIIGQLQLI